MPVYHQVCQLFFGASFQNSNDDLLGDCPSDIVINAEVHASVEEFIDELRDAGYELALGQGVDLLSDYDIYAVFQSLFKGCFVFTNDLIEFTQNFQIFCYYRHVQERFNDDMEILSLIGVSSELSRFHGEMQFLHIIERGHHSVEYGLDLLICKPIV